MFFDGAAGTYFQMHGISEPPYLLNMNNPSIVEEMHAEYIYAGADIITLNTFGLSGLNGGDCREIIKAAAGCANRAINRASGGRKIYTALDIGPTGRLLQPLGDLPFEEAVSIFSGIIHSAGDVTDFILIETMNDSLETKAAVVAAKESSNLPIFVTNAYEKTGRLLTGADAFSMAVMLEGLGVSALGVNCGFGPGEALPVVKELVKRSSIPVIAMPNAGLPRSNGGNAEYDLPANEFAEQMRELAKSGACILGGCCGTTPEYIEKTIDAVRDIPYVYPEKKHYTAVSSYGRTVLFEGIAVPVGERINPTGKPRLKEALRSGDVSYILSEGLRQREKGALILDVNVGLPEINEPEMLKTAVRELQSVCELPLQVDTADPAAMEGAMRIYNGKPMVNSVNGKAESLRAVLPLVKKYGGVAVALTLDENGIPGSAEDRIKIADRILGAAAEYGIDEHDIIFDPLAMAVSADNNAAITAVETVNRLSLAGRKTILGVSNISFGLPNRGGLTATFLTLAMQSGLSAAILNPDSEEVMGAYRSFAALTGDDPDFRQYIAFCDGKSSDNGRPDAAQTVDLSAAIEKGLKDAAATSAVELLKSEEPMAVVNGKIIPALDRVGKGFENKTVYLPGLLMSAEAAQAAFEQIRLHSSANANKKNCPPVILATVEGDIHDIGKNIVKLLLENYGFTVIDLGKDVPAEKIIESAVASNSTLVGLSALMTTTVPAMAKTVAGLHKVLPECKVAVGGAVLNENIAQSMNADRYCRDAMETVRYAQEILLGQHPVGFPE